jgi:hypothetical protein
LVALAHQVKIVAAGAALEALKLLAGQMSRKGPVFSSFGGFMQGALAANLSARSLRDDKTQQIEYLRKSIARMAHPSGTEKRNP